MSESTPISLAQQEAILRSIRDIVPDKVRNQNERRHVLLVGAVIALQSIDHALVPPHWLMNVMAGRTDRLFLK